MMATQKQIGAAVDAVRNSYRCPSLKDCLAGTVDCICYKIGEAALAAAEAAGWEPIETAPKDGTTILVCNRYGVCEARWINRDNEPGEITGWCSSPRGIDPTHWRPLPEPPAG